MESGFGPFLDVNKILTFSSSRNANVRKEEGGLPTVLKASYLFFLSQVGRLMTWKLILPSPVKVITNFI